MEEAAIFSEWVDELTHDPEYVVHELLCDITEDICAAMNRRGMNRADLARQLEVSPQYISEFLNTPHNTTLKQIVRFAAAVGLDVAVSLSARESTQIPAPSSPEATDWKNAGPARSLSRLVRGTSLEDTDESLSNAA